MPLKKRQTMAARSGNFKPERANLAAHQDRPFAMLISRTICLLVLLSLALPAGAQDEPGVWRDSATGYAIGGYDPVAFHTRGAAVKGEARFAHRWGGAAWAFENEGNRAAFAEAPQIYAPRFFGFDPTSIAHRTPVQGLPVHWHFDSSGLYFFYRATNRAAFLADTAPIMQEAEKSWPIVSMRLAGVRDR